PPLDRLERLTRLLGRLEALPASVGPIDLAVVRDVTLPLPATWPSSSTTTGPPPERIEAAWLAGVLPSVRAPAAGPARLWRTARALRPLPTWSLTCLWLLEVALAWPGGGETPGLLADLGESYCQTGDLIEGVALLDRAAERDASGAGEYAFRAARWVAQINAETASERLLRLREGASDRVRTFAEMELLALEPPGGERDDLLDRAARVDALVARASQCVLSNDERRRLSARACQVI